MKATKYHGTEDFGARHNKNKHTHMMVKHHSSNRLNAGLLGFMRQKLERRTNVRTDSSISE